MRHACIKSECLLISTFLFLIEDDALRIHWKQLKDNFRKCVSRRSKQPSGSAAWRETKSKYFESLMFLRDKVENRPSCSNVLLPELPSPLSSTPSASKRPATAYPEERPAKISREASSIATDAMIVETLQELKDKRMSEAEDSDTLFCLSLCGILKKLSPRQNRRARMRLLDVLYEIEFENA